MSIITKFLAVVTEPQFKLARDLTAMAIADGHVTPEEMEAMKTICHLEGVDEKKLVDALKGGYDKVEEEMPKDRHDKEGYLRDVIRLIGADGYTAPQEVYLFQIIASRMGLNQMDVISMFLLTATRQYFKGDMGAKILASFLHNYIDPKGKLEKDNRENLRTIYDTVASNTEVSRDEELDKEILRQNLARATETFLENGILMREFADVGINFADMARQEEQNVFKKYVSS
jgi:uncharacterized tellurite resistance protein B-like protein